MSKTFCKHIPHIVIDEIREPKYSTNEVLINVNKINPYMEHYLIKFSLCPSIKDWFYLSGKTIRKSKKQKNGAGTMYAVSLNEREEFTPIINCEHQY